MRNVSIPLSRGSLCNKYPLAKGFYVNEFQSLCRGEASATTESMTLEQKATVVSIPLSRGSLCNYTMTSLVLLQGSDRFNPSVEGKPLQPTGSSSLKVSSMHCFNPSVEGKPLQLEDLPDPKFGSAAEFQSLCRGEASATY